MPWNARNLVDSVSSADGVGARLVYPFGLALKIGDVVSASDGANLTLEGSCQSLLGKKLSAIRQGPPGDFLVQSKSKVSFAYRAAGTASTQFPQLPSANARYEIGLEEEQSWLVACTGRVMHSLTELAPLRQGILDSYARGVWQKHWALVYEVGIVDGLTLLAAKSRNTNLALTLGATVAPTATDVVKLTADVMVAQSTSSLVQWIPTAASVAFYNAIRIREHWFTPPDVATLESPQAESTIAKAEFDEVWESTKL